MGEKNKPKKERVPLAESTNEDIEEDEYEVEAIRYRMWSPEEKRWMFMIKWKNYPESDNTLEPKEYLSEDLQKVCMEVEERKVLKSILGHMPSTAKRGENNIKYYVEWHEEAGEKGLCWSQDEDDIPDKLLSVYWKKAGKRSKKNTAKFVHGLKLMHKKRSIVEMVEGGRKKIKVTESIEEKKETIEDREGMGGGEESVTLKRIEQQQKKQEQKQATTGKQGAEASDMSPLAMIMPEDNIECPLYYPPKVEKNKMKQKDMRGKHDKHAKVSNIQEEVNGKHQQDNGVDLLKKTIKKKTRSMEKTACKKGERVGFVKCQYCGRESDRTFNPWCSEVCQWGFVGCRLKSILNIGTTV